MFVVPHVDWVGPGECGLTSVWLQEIEYIPERYIWEPLDLNDFVLDILLFP